MGRLVTVMVGCAMAIGGGSPLAFAQPSVEGTEAPPDSDEDAQANDLDEALELCFSEDEAARRYCLRRIAGAPVAHGGARLALAHLAQGEDAIAAEARALYRRRHGRQAPGIRGDGGRGSEGSTTPVPPEQSGSSRPSTGAEGAEEVPPFPDDAEASPSPPRRGSGAGRPSPPPPSSGIHGTVPPPPPPAPPVVRRAPPPRPLRPRPNDESRIHLTPTAYNIEEGRKTFTFLGPALYRIDVGVTERLQVEVTTAFPAGVVGAHVGLRLAFPFESGAFALTAGGGGAWVPSYGVEGGGGAGYLGAILTLGTETLIFNLGYAVGGGGFRDRLPEGTGVSNVAGASISGHAAFRAHLGRVVALHVEALVGGAYGSGITRDFGEVAVLDWGFRFRTSSSWIDLSLVFPIADEILDSDVYEVWPLGYPWVHWGFDL